MKARVVDHMLSDIHLPEGWCSSWKVLKLQHPVVTDDAVSLEAEMDALQRLAEGAVESWWKGYATEALENCLSGGAEVGALFEREEHRPDVRVLGTWAAQ